MIDNIACGFAFERVYQRLVRQSFRCGGDEGVRRANSAERERDRL